VPQWPGEWLLSILFFYYFNCPQSFPHRLARRRLVERSNASRVRDSKNFKNTQIVFQSRCYFPFYFFPSNPIHVVFMSASDTPLACDLDHKSTVTKQLDMSENVECSSIPSLPVELLSKIFLLASMDDYSEKTRIAITHVCYFWRETAINCFHLWSAIHIARNAPGERSRVIEFRRRSNGAPLSISVGNDMDKTHYRNPQLQKIIIDSLAQTRELSSPVGVVQFLLCPAPALESLTLVRGKDGHQFSLQLIAFEGHTPCLRKVVLRDVRLNWRSSIFKDLTELSIHGPHMFDIDRIHFLDSLARMPALELLDLRHAKLVFTTRSSLRNLPPRNLVMSSLRTFIFSRDLELCSFILENLVLQHVQKLDIQILFQVTHSDNQCLLVSKILSFIAEHCNDHDAKLDIRGKTVPGGLQTAWVHRFSYTSDNVRLEILIMGPPRSHIPFLEVIRVTLPRKNITHIEIEETPNSNIVQGRTW